MFGAVLQTVFPPVTGRYVQFYGIIPRRVPLMNLSIVLPHAGHSSKRLDTKVCVIDLKDAALVGFDCEAALCASEQTVNVSSPCSPDMQKSIHLISSRQVIMGLYTGGIPAALSFIQLDTLFCCNIIEVLPSLPLSQPKQENNCLEKQHWVVVCFLCPQCLDFFFFFSTIGSS